jgi:uncharacterized membrane protein YkoI
MKKSTRWTIGGAAAVALLAGGGGVAIAAVGDDEDSRPDVAITGEALERASEAALSHVGGGEVTDSEVGDGEGYYEVEVTREDGSEIDVHLDEEFSVIGDEQDDAEAGDQDEQVTGSARDEAAAAAVEAAGGGTVTDVERADDGGTGYEVDVRLDDGTSVDVVLGEDFAVAAVENDD